MANAIYPLYKQALLDASANVDINDGTVKVALVDTGTYTYSAADEFLTSLTGVVGTAQTIANTTVTNGTFDGDNVTYTAVTGATVEALVIYIDTGVAGTSRLVCYIDTSVTGFPLTPNGGDVTISWNASGIFTISDRRMKENVDLVDGYGDLGIYQYNYIGEERMRLGFMAHEVEKLAPAAVLDFGSHKRVNYHAAFAAVDREAA